MRRRHLVLLVHNKPTSTIPRPAGFDVTIWIEYRRRFPNALWFFDSYGMLVGIA